MPIIELSYQSGPNVECGMCASHAFFGLSGGENRNHPSPSVINFIFICLGFFFFFLCQVQLLWKKFPVKQLAFHLISSAIFNYQADQIQ